jgi:hypothetical protein
VILITKPDEEEFRVERPNYYQWSETKGFHHFKFKSAPPKWQKLVGHKVAVPLSDIKFLILD